MARNRVFPTMAVVLCALGAWPSSVSQARIINVNAAGTADFATIQAAIDDANDGDTVLLAPGTYRGDGNRDIDFKVRAIIVTGTDPNDWDVVANTIIDCNGTEDNFHRGFHFHSGEGSESLLEGVTVTGGYGENRGGAIFCENASCPTISKCIISENLCGITKPQFESWIAGYGGAISCIDQSNTTLSHCTVRDNSNVQLHYNESGGGIYCFDSKLVIADCTIEGNSALDGGGISVGRWADVTIQGCVIRGNAAMSHGGGIVSQGESREGSVVISNCLVLDNSSGEYGGGLYSYRFNVLMTNSVVAGNYAIDGGGVYCAQGRWTLTNCTVANNEAATHGGGVGCGPAGGAVLENCILWGNTATLGRQVSLPNPAHILGAIEVEITHSCIETGPNAGYWDGNDEWALEAGDDGNIDTNPYFADANAGDFTLQSQSPCIDAGTNETTITLPLTDVAGADRFVDGDLDGIAAVDLGAYEALPSDEVLIWSSAQNCLFIVNENENDIQGEVLTIRNRGRGILSWTATSDCSWLTITPDHGSSSNEADEIILLADPTGLAVGSHVCEVVISDPSAINDGDGIVVTLRIRGETVHVPAQVDTIQEGMDHAVDGGTIVIADGIYTGPGNRDLSFEGRPLTIRSENGPGACIIDCEGTEWFPHHGFRFYNGEDTNSILDGLAITNAEGSGAAIRCKGSSPVIKNCQIVNNGGSGGIACKTTSSSSQEAGPMILDCVISGNESTGVYLRDHGTNPLIAGCIIAENGGHGISCTQNNPTITDCVISGNGRTGIRLASGVDGEINHCVISGNGNKSTLGGGVYADLSTSRRLNLDHCVIVGNTGDIHGFGIRCLGALLTMNQCVLAGNRKGLDYASVVRQATVTNCILWDANGIEDTVDSSVVLLSYCNVRGGWPGEGNIDLDPLFVEPGYWDTNGTPDDMEDDVWVDGDYHLRSQAGRWDSADERWVQDDVTSPCIDAGDPNSPVGDEPAPNGDRINMGAYGGTKQASKSHPG